MIYFKCHNPSFFKNNDVYETENEEIVQYINYVVVGLRNAVITEKYPKNENPHKVIDIVEEILNFRKRRKKKNFFQTQLA